MARYTGPRNRIARRFGVDLGLKTNSAKVARRLSQKPGVHGPTAKGRNRQTEYGLQLMEKQKAKYIYGVMERQFRRYYQNATKRKGDTGEYLLQLLERRLDNAVYRAGLADTRAQARQLVVHGHVQVNGKKVDRPSYSVDVNDSIEVLLELKNTAKKKQGAVAWLTVPNEKERIVKITNLPTSKDIVEPLKMRLIIEHYSR